MLRNFISPRNLMAKHQAILLLLDQEVVSQQNFQKMADELAHQARFEYKLVFPVLIEPCNWQESSLKQLTVYPLNQKAISEWNSDEEGWNQVFQEIANVLKPYHSFYLESPRAIALRGIGKISLPTGQVFASGFLVSNDLLLTSTLLIDSKENARQASVTFMDVGGLSATFNLLPDDFFLLDTETNVSLVRVAETPDQSDYRQPRTIQDYFTLKLATKPPKLGDALISASFESVQHVLADYQIIDSADEEQVHYRGPHQAGAAGGPLLNVAYEVVAVNPNDRVQADPYSQKSVSLEEPLANVSTLNALLKNMQKSSEAWIDANGRRVRPTILDSFTNFAWQRDNDPDGINADIAQNRTLLVLQLTADPPPAPLIQERLQTISDVFEHFNPEITIDFKDGDAIVSETLRFNKLDDFGLNGITTQSPFLQGLHNQQADLDTFRRHLVSNKTLQKVLSASVDNAAFLTALRAMVQEIEEAAQPNNETSVSAGNLVKPTNPAQQLAESIEQLAKFGGFDFLAGVVEGVSTLNPKQKARKGIFLRDPQQKVEREKLKKRLNLLTDLLENFLTVASTVTQAEVRTKKIVDTLETNQLAALDVTRELETAYYSLVLFYKNADTDKIKNLSILNADPHQIQDLDDLKFFEAINAELSSNYDRLDLRNSYSLLVIPGFLGRRSILDRYADLVYKTKVMLLTDYRNLETAEDVLAMFERDKLQGDDRNKGNVIMTCNYLIGRQAFDEVGEVEPLCVPPSAALAGKIYKTAIQQSVRTLDSMNDMKGMRFNMSKPEIANLEKMGLVPVVNEYLKSVLFSARTLYNGDNQGLQTYPAVRIFDWITKVLIDFLNRRVFENWTYDAQKDQHRRIESFLGSITAPGEIIEGYKLLRFERDPQEKDRIHLNIHLIPHTPNKTFLLHFDGRKGDDGTDWQTDVQLD